MGRPLRKELRCPCRLFVGSGMCISPDSSHPAPGCCAYHYGFVSRIRRNTSPDVQHNYVIGPEAQRPDYWPRNLHQFRRYGHRSVLLPATDRMELYCCTRHLRLRTNPGGLRSALWLSWRAPWLHANDQARPRSLSFLVTVGKVGRVVAWDVSLRCFVANRHGTAPAARGALASPNSGSSIN